MDKIKKIDCENVDELIKNILNLPQDFVSNWIYRGESSIRYRLLPSALRKDGREKLRLISMIKNGTGSLDGYVIEEFSAIVGFYESANNQGLYVPYHKELQTNHHILLHILQDFVKDREINPVYYELISLAQHYGIPTRFLDWTNDFYVAFFFAFRSAVYKIYENIARNSVKDGLTDKIVVWALDRGNLQIPPRDAPIRFITPCYNNNPNLAAQKGTFSYYNFDIDLGS